MVGLAVIGVIFWKLPVMEIATMFFYIVVVPLMFFSALGLISRGTLDLFSSSFSEFSAELSKRVAEHRKNLGAAQATPPEAPATPVM